MKKTVAVLGLILVVLAAVSCTKKQDNPSVTPSEVTQAVNPEITPEGTPTAEATISPTPTQKNTPTPTLNPAYGPKINWVVSFINGPTKAEQDKINRLLREKGVDCYVNFIYNVHADDAEEYLKWLDEAHTSYMKYDIINSQARPAESNKNYPLIIERDYMIDLSEYLQTELGAKLYQAYAPMDWDLIRIDGAVHSIPSITTWSHRYRGVFLSVNDKYAEWFEDFDGSYESLRKIYDDIGDRNLVIQMDMTGQVLFACMGYQTINNAILYDQKQDRILSVLDVSDQLNTLTAELHRDLSEGILEAPYGQEKVEKEVLAEYYRFDRKKKEGYTDILITEDLGLARRGFNYGISKDSEKKDLAFRVLATCYSDPEIAAILRKPVDAEEEGSWEERMERLKDVDITKAPLFGFSVFVNKAEYPAENYMSEHVITMVLIELFGANYYSPNRSVNPVYHELDFTNVMKSLSYSRLIEEYRRQLGEFRKKQNSGS